jgi:hypothetical protein
MPRDDIIIKPVEPAAIEKPPTVYEILVAAPNSGFFDAEGNEVVLYRKETIYEDQITRQRAQIIEEHTRQLAEIDAKLDAINKLKGE